MRIRCPVCDGDTVRELPVLSNAGQGMISDGRLVSRPIHKASCLACGTGFCAHPPQISEVSAWYSEGYGLAVAAPEADAARARIYADWLMEAGLGQDGLTRLLDVGSGSGRVLQELATRFTDSEFVGCEPSLPGHSRLSDSVMLYQGGIEAVPGEGTFQTIVAINVIEHTLMPAQFLTSLSTRLAPDGQIFIVCPNGAEPNFELVFVDHLYSLTTASMEAAARTAGLAIEAWSSAPPGLGLFTLYRLRLASKWKTVGSCTDFAQLAERRAIYLRAWSELDGALLSRTDGERCIAFGAGQMAALLRAYAPNTWARVTQLSLDVPSDGWLLDRPVFGYSPSKEPHEPVILATSPSAQGRLAQRVSVDGYRPIRFDDIIPY